MLRIAALAVLSILIITSALGQSHQPYAGLQSRDIKALSEDQLRDLREGRGMGLALAAELNGYPGPMHVLELAERIGLTQEQHVRMRGLFNAMKAEAVALGAKLIAQEAELDRQFATRSVTSGSLSAATADIAATQGKLREAHLKYHLATVAILSPEQVRRYSELRGYASGGSRHTPGGHHRRAH
jgi:Spy/CpxP family protein refolding chaperone